MANILVTGGLGTIGAPLVAELRQRGHVVVSLDLRHQPDQHAYAHNLNQNQSLPYPGAISLGNYYIRCDVASFRQIEDVFLVEDFDYVYHTAAEFGRWNGEDYYEQLWRTNCIGTKNILRMQHDVGFNLIFLSSSEIYGDWQGIMTEDVPDKHPLHLLNDYAISKWANEMQIKNAELMGGGPSVVVRLFNTFGLERYSPYRSVNCRFLYSALTNNPWTVHRGHSRTSTYISDTVRTLANITGNFIPGEIYNIAGDTLHTIEELSDIVLKVTWADKNLVQLADPEHMTTKIKQVSIEKAKRDLDHKCTINLFAGMSMTARWMKGVYNL